MTAYLDVFERKEMKYRLCATQLESLISAFETRLLPDERGITLVRSLYFDTPAHDLIARSMESPLYKEKLRLRVYGQASEPGTPAFLEIKKKFKGIVYKRRVLVSIGAAHLIIEGASLSEALAAHPLNDEALAAEALTPHREQIAREIAFFIQRHDARRPSILTQCERQAFTSSDGDLRVTIDRNLSYKANPQSIADTHFAIPLIPQTEAVMELKCTHALPLWLAGELSAVCAYKQSFSKCGTAYGHSVSEQAQNALPALKKGA